MLTLIPALPILKALTDRNISGEAANQRVICFSNCTDLITLINASVIIEGTIFKKIKDRLNEDQVTYFESTYNIDNSGVNVCNYDIFKSIKFISKRESLNRQVIIIADSPNDYVDKEISGNKNIIIYTPKEFNLKYDELIKAINNIYAEISDIQDDAALKALIIKKALLILLSKK